MADTGGVQVRYTALPLVEQALRTCRTSHLEVRPVYVRTAASTQGLSVVELAVLAVLYPRVALLLRRADGK